METIAHDSIAEQIVFFINHTLNPSQAVTAQTHLIASGLLDSASFKVLAVFLEETFVIELAGCDMTEQWFRSAEKLALLVVQKMTQQAPVCG